MHKQKLIFIVDDDPFINMLIVKRFSADGYKLEAFLSGEECLESLDTNPDLIILDYFFIHSEKQIMNGLEVFNKLVELRPDIPVIMVSGQDRGEVVLELARKGIADYIIKDNNLIENLTKSIGELFGKKKA
jgi:two-component system, OmpR family, response regulator